MKKIKFGLTLALAALVAAGCLSSLKSYEKHPSLPSYSGTLEIPALKSRVDIYRDNYGIPHVFAENESDLFFAVGYAQAQDRLWSMVFMRAASQGRISEIFGNVNLPGLGNTFEIDTHQRVWGMKWLGEVSAALIKEYNPEEYAQLQAYCDGVNAFIDTHRDWKDLPVELQVLRLKPEHWQVSDVASYGIFMGYELGSNMDEELKRMVLINELGPDLAWQLFPIYNSPAPIIVPNELLKNKLDTPRDIPPGGRPSDQELGLNASSLIGYDVLVLAGFEAAVKKALHLEAPYASNNWIVMGKLTESGDAMLANDPHLEHMEPSLFYPMHIKAGEIDAFGVAFAGVPYPVLGHTRKLSWGATTPPADVQDLFIETVDPKRPGMYRYQGEWRPFTIRKEIIRVRSGTGLKEKEIEIRQSVHGPIINDIIGDVPEGSPPMALRWAAWDFSRDLAVFDALVGSVTVDEFMAKARKMDLDDEEFTNIALMYNILLKGDSIDDFIRAMGKIGVPSQNWVAADAAGSIVYLPGGLVPVRNKGIGVVPVPGESGEFDWTGFVPLLDLPHAIDPARGYMATANNMVVDPRYYPYVFGTCHDEGWRAWRIEELIRELAPLSMEDMKRIQNDVQVRRAVWQIPIMEEAVKRSGTEDPIVRVTMAELSGWDRESDVESVETVLFFTFLLEMRRNVFEDEAPPEIFQQFLDSNGMEYVIISAMEKGDSPLFDDKRTPQIETMDDMIVKSLRDTGIKVEAVYGPNVNRRWGQLHQITFESPIGVGPLKKLNLGPFPHSGARETVRNASFSGKGEGPWTPRSGPVLRHIMDMGDPDGAQMVIDGSVSGQWLSPHYDDLVKLWLNGEYVTAVMDPELVKAEAKYHLVMEP
jgi:penicillin amidase